jgi:tRNA(fMet)-specific endonuclease VapC
MVKQRLNGIGADACCVSIVSVLELRYGAENSSDPSRFHHQLNEFLQGLTTVPIDNIVMRYAKEKTRLRKSGIPLHDEFDLLIGVTAVEHNYILVTDNTKHFSRIENIQLQNWLTP